MRCMPLAPRLVLLVSLAWACWAAAIACLGNDVATADGEAAPGEQCVLLRNGHVLVGRVVRDGDVVIVRRKDASLHLPTYQVEAVCEDLNGAYLHRRQSIDPHQAGSRIKLAEWCLQQGLLDQARQELAAVRQLDATHPRIAILEKRLAVAEQPTQFASRAPSAASGSSAPIDDQVALASFLTDEPTGRQQLAEYPADTMEQFRRRIQPLLLNSCTASGCHWEGGGSSFVMDREALWPDAPREITARNLSAVLGQVRRDAPLESRLLTAAASPHAQPLTAPPLASESLPLARLKEWVLHLCGQDRPAGAPREAVAAPPAEAAEDDDAEGLIDEAELDALFNEMVADGIIAPRPIQRGLRPAETGTADPFDPEAFNRRNKERQP